MSSDSEPRKIDTDTSFLDWFLDAEEEHPRIILAIGYAGYRFVKDLLHDTAWRNTLKNHGATEYDVAILEKALKEAGLLPHFTPEAAKSLLGEDDQAERISRAVTMMPGNAASNLQNFLLLVGQDKNAGLIQRIESTSAWSNVGASSLLKEITIDSLGLSLRARNVLAKLGVHTLADLRERTLKASELLAQSPCGPQTLNAIIKALKRLGVAIVNDSEYTF